MQFRCVAHHGDPTPIPPRCVSIAGTSTAQCSLAWFTTDLTCLVSLLQRYSKRSEARGQSSALGCLAQVGFPPVEPAMVVAAAIAVGVGPTLELTTALEDAFSRYDLAVCTRLSHGCGSLRAPSRHQSGHL